MKILLISLFSCVCSIVTAQNNVFYFKKNGRQVNLRDSADYTRVFLPPAEGSQLFTVNEFYINGTPKLSGKATSFDPMKLQGQCSTFYENGNKREILNFENGIQVGDQSYFFNDGKPFAIIEYPSMHAKPDANAILSRQFLIKEVHDNTGAILVTGGNGYYKGPEIPKGDVWEEGNIKNGKKDATWKGTFKRTTFTEIYEDGKLLTGTAVDNKGQESKYTKSRNTTPEFAGGVTKFYKFLSQIVRYPDYERSNKIQGRVLISFVVEKDGTLNDLTVARSVSRGLDAEALRVIGESPKWVPGTQFGVPVKVKYTVPIVFTLQ